MAATVASRPRVARSRRSRPAGYALRPYQREIAVAVLGAIERRRGETLSVEVARQGGKNETSAWIEMLTLVREAQCFTDAIKAAPTFRPQALISRRRLLERLYATPLAPYVRTEGSSGVRLGNARQLFVSAEAGASVVGHTVHTLMEIDEAQDVERDKFNREFRPMASSTGAVTVFYGTAWTDDTLLEEMKQHHLGLERKDGQRRHFRVTWEEVGRWNEPYRRFVEAERERLGEANPLFRTQYVLEPVAGGGRLLPAVALAQLFAGSHARASGPVAGERYVAGLDLAGAGDSPRVDATVLAILRVLAPAGLPEHGQRWEAPEPVLEVVDVVALVGVAAPDLVPRLADLLGSVWRVDRVAVDSTGLGEPIAADLERRLGSRVRPFRFTAESKSRLGFGLVSAVTSGRLRCFANDGSAEWWALRSEAAAARVTYRPNATIAWGVDPAEGHDDHLVSLALAVSAATDAGPRVARGR